MSPLPFILLTALAMNDPAASDGMVLDFSATWCGPCQQMSPMVSRLARQGYPIQKIDVDQHREFAQQYQIEKMPTFVLVVRGKEVSRVVGQVSEDDLMRMFEQIPRKPAPTVAAAPRVVKVKTPKIVRANMENEPAPFKRLDLSPSPMAASTRIRIRDKSGENYGSGTIIDSRPGNTIVLTCGHIFRNLDDSSVIEVDVFTKDKSVTYVGKLLKFDIEAEVGLVSIATDNPLPACRVAKVGYRMQKDQPVESIGCGGGELPTSYNLKITALNRYLGPDNIECNGIPVQGRSGGGLFSKDGFVIGVCMAADHKGNRGLYSSLQPIHDLLDKCQLARVYRPEGEAIAGKSASTQSAAKTTDPSANEESTLSTDDLNIDLAALRDARPADAVASNVGANTGKATASSANTQTASLEESDFGDSLANNTAKLSDNAEPAEVVCVIRPIKNPRGASKVVVINRASTKFMNYLTDELQSQSEVKPTSYPVRTASISDSSARSTTGAYRRTRALSW